MLLHQNLLVYTIMVKHLHVYAVGIITFKKYKTAQIMVCEIRSDANR